VRLFVGVYPPAAGVERLLGVLAGIGLAEHRVVAAEQVHLTLQFVGEVRVNHVDEIGESVERSVAGIERFELTPLMLATLPERGAPRLVAAMTDAPPGLVEMHRRLAHRLAGHVRARGKERFTPHLTLCRFAHGAKADRVAKALDEPGFVVERVLLMRSVLGARGAVHREVRGFGLD
jgi:2'-5' RNA ligase